MAIISFAMKVQRLRSKRGWTQDQLAKKAKLHLVTIGRIEAGMRKDPDLTTRKKLAKALGVPITELLD
jgi:transcriptional regulator with XRE-family HTH domain